VSPFLLAFTLVVAGLIALGLRRAFAGPTVFDRLVAVALVTVNGVVVLVLLGFLFDRPVFFLDIAMAYALLAFVLPIAVSRYFEQRERYVPPRPLDGNGSHGNGGDGDDRSDGGTASGADAPPAGPDGEERR
jgi:multicomponent Na+:H+ antiporter subunit F